MNEKELRLFMDIAIKFRKNQEYDTIIIHRHMKPDPDALGSQVGLKALLKHHFPEKNHQSSWF